MHQRAVDHLTQLAIANRAFTGGEGYRELHRQFSADLLPE
jgi:hypothetical protein